MAASKTKMSPKEKAAKALHKAECDYLLACGWKKKPNEKTLKWVAPAFPDFRHWNGVFKGDTLFHNRAISTQRSFDEESKDY